MREGRRDRPALCGGPRGGGGLHCAGGGKLGGPGRGLGGGGGGGDGQAAIRDLSRLPPPAGCGAQRGRRPLQTPPPPRPGVVKAAPRRRRVQAPRLGSFC